jgi:hypothetical protein
MSAKEKLILQVMEEMEVSRDIAVEIVGDEEEEDEEVKVTKVVLIPTAQEKKTNFTNIFADTTIEPLETKLRNIMDAQLNATRLVVERGKVATDNFTLGVFRQRDVNDRTHTGYAVDTDEPAISDFLRAASFQFTGFDFSGATFESWFESISTPLVKFSGTTYYVRRGSFPFVMYEQTFARYKQECLQDLRGCDTLHLLRQTVGRGRLRAGGQAATDTPHEDQPHRQWHVPGQPPPNPRHQTDGHHILRFLPGDL